MKNNIFSALICIRRLLQLIGKKAQSIETFSQENNLSKDKVIEKKALTNLVKKYCAAASVNVRIKSIAWEKLTDKYLPLAFQDKAGDFILLARMNNEEALLQRADSHQPEIVKIADLAEMWGGICISLQQSRFDIRWFIPVFMRYRTQLLQVLFLSFILQLLTLISPLYFQVIMDKVLVHNALTTLNVLIITLIITGVFEVVLKGLREYFFSHATTKVDIQLGGKLYDHLIRLPLSYFKQRHVGMIVSRVRELDNIREFLTGSAMTLCVDVFFSIILFAVMWCISSYLTLVALSAIPLFILLAAITTGPLHKRVGELCGTAAQNSSFLTESIAGIETVKSLALEPRMQHRWEEQTCDFALANYNVQKLQTFSNQIAQLIQKGLSALVIILGSYQVMNVQLTIGQLIALNMLLGQAMQPMSKLLELWQQSIRAKIGLSLLADILTLPTENENSNNQPIVPLIKGDIIFDHITFCYRPDLPPVLQALTLAIQAGEHIGFVGASGSGKSTIARLLLRLYTPTNGQILLDNQPLQNYPTQFLRKQVGIVMQENYLFNRSVRDNIAHSHPTATIEEVIHAACLAGADDFILALPLGYDTILAEGGASLSGGQRQRIAIARTLLANPRILIFDEATSALDDESQERIQKNMAKIVQNRTVITIAHRLSTVRHCHRIAVIQNGQIIELASHNALLSINGYYARLWNQQLNFSDGE